MPVYLTPNLKTFPNSISFVHSEPTTVLNIVFIILLLFFYSFTICSSKQCCFFCFLIIYEYNSSKTFFTQYYIPKIHPCCFLQAILFYSCIILQKQILGVRSDRVPEELLTEVCNIIQEVVIRTIPKRNKCKKARQLSEEGLQIAVKREAKSKGEKERYIHLNAEFQRIARRDKNPS